MLFTDSFFLDIKRIHLAHKFILDRVHKCEYPLGREHYGLVLVLRGNAEYRFCTGERFTVTDGDMFFLAPHAAYTVVAEKSFEHYTVNFDVHEDTSKTGALNKPFCLLKGERSEQIKRGFVELINVWTSKNTGFEMQAIGCLYGLLSQFYLEYVSEHNTVSYNRLLPAKEYIDQHFDRPITLEELAKLSTMSVTNFRREWKKNYTHPPLQYRDTIRLYYAKEYLSSGYYTVSQIAQKCGFDDVSYFVRFFKKQTGITPGEFKNQFLGK